MFSAIGRAIRGIYDQPSLEAPLLNSLTLKRGVGNPTFTRSDTANYSATVTDFEGLIRPVKINEARFEGARRVENLIPTSSASLASGSNKTVTVPAGEYVFSMGAGASSGVATFSGTGGATGTLTQNATYRTAANKFTLTAGTFIVTASVATLVDLMFSNVTGQANQNPAEYVSVGVLSAPYHGAGVDGVAYKITTNGNTVSNGIVTEAVGANISSSVLKKLKQEWNATNYALYSQVFSNAAWAVTNIAVANDTLGSPAGMTTADTLTATADNATILQTITLSSANVTFSVYIKRKTGTGNIYLTTDGGTTWTAKTITTDWVRYSVNKNPVTNPVIGIKIETNTDELYVWGAQVEKPLGTQTLPSSYIVTGSTTNARGRQYLTYSANNINLAEGSYYAEVYTDSVSNGIFAVGHETAALTNGIYLQLKSGGVPRLQVKNGATVEVDISSSQSGTDSFIKCAAKWSATDSKVFCKGVASAADTSSTMPSTKGYITVGDYENGYGSYGYVGNIKIWKIAKSDTFLKAITA
jgi:hypothetical protein